MVEMSQSVFRAGTYFWSGVVTTLGPGILLLCELLILVAAPDRMTGLPVLRPYAALWDSAGAIGSVLLALIGLSIAYCLGFLAKQLMFGRLRGPAGHGENWAKELLVLRAVFGPETVESALIRHSLSGSLKEPSKLTDEEVDYIFVYCKVWLRSREPSLNVDHLEVEINLYLGLIPSIAVAWFALARFLAAWELSNPSVGTVVLLVVSLAVSSWIVYAMWKKSQAWQQQERSDALRNLVLGTRYEATDVPVGAQMASPAAIIGDP